MAGQKLGASALLCYIHRDPSEAGGVFSLTVANVGTCQAVLCRDGRPVPLSKVYSLENCTEERERVKAAKAIITEVIIGDILMCEIAIALCCNFKNLALNFAKKKKNCNESQLV